MNFIFENITQEDINVAITHLEAKKEVYLEYLKTDYWKKLSKIAKDRDGNRCRLCDSRMNLNIHHRSYRWKGNPEKELEDLITICEDCHGRHHGKIKIKQLNPERTILSMGQLNRSNKKKKKKWIQYGIKNCKKFRSNRQVGIPQKWEGYFDREKKNLTNIVKF